MKKKILFLVPLPPPIYGAAVSSRLCLNSKELNKNFNIRHVRLNHSETLEDVGKPTLRKFFGFFVTCFKIIRDMIFFRPDLVYFSIAPLGFGFMRDSVFVLLCKLFRRKIIFHLRGRGIKREIRNPLKHFLYSSVFRNSKVIILNHFLYEDIREIIKRDDVFVLPNAIKNELDDAEFEKIMKKREKRKTPNILFLSNMDETKGPMILLRACRILSEKGIEFRCNFVGAWLGDELRKKFENYISAHELGGKVKYLGIKTGKEKNEIMSKSDILAFPTYYRQETFGLVAVEAMEYGMPVVANRIASLPLIVDQGKTGLVMDKNIPEELAGYLERIIKNRKESIMMGREGRKRFMKKYCFSEYESKLKSVFENYFSS